MTRWTRSNLFGMLTLGGVAALLPGSQSHAQQQDPVVRATSRATLDAAQAEVKAAEQNLERAESQYRAAVIPATDVLQAKVQLSEARIRLYLLQQPQPTQKVLDEMTVIVGYQEEVFNANVAQRQAGILSSLDIMKARGPLAEARIRRELYELVATAKQDLDAAVMAMKQGVGGLDCIDQAKAALAKAQRRFAANEAERAANG